MNSLNSKKIYRLHTINFDLKEFHDGYVLWLLGAYSLTKSFLPKPSFLTSFSNRDLIIVLKMCVKQRLDDRETMFQKWYLRWDLNYTSLKFYNVANKNMQRKTRAVYNRMSLYLKRIMVQTSVGFRKGLIVSGVGYKFKRSYNYLYVSLGWIHSPHWRLAKNVMTKLSNKGKSLILRHFSLPKLTASAAMIKRVRPVGVYINKGIRYKQEIVIRKKGKKKRSA